MNKSPTYSQAIKTHSRVPKRAAGKLPWVVEMIAVDGLKPAKRNARCHNDHQVDLLANSMFRFGVVKPIVIDERDRIVAGHGVWLAAKKLGLKTIPTVRLSHLSELELRAYALADNQLATKSAWDRDSLWLELGELEVALPDVGLDLSMLGFEAHEIDGLNDSFGDVTPDSADEIPAPLEGPPVSRIGDVFVLNRHRLVVGDARDPSAFEHLMQGNVAEMGIHDPPYNVRIQGNVGGRGRIKRREFACASGEMSKSEFITFLKSTLSPCALNSTDGAIHFVFIDWRHFGELLAAGAEVFDELKNTCVWVKSNAGQGTFYRSQHELVAVFKHGTGPHLNNFGLGANGRTRSNVWRYAGVNAFRAGRMDELEMHPTTKPVAMIADAMRDCSRRGSIILDAFAGSGTTIMAAEQIGRRAFCMEIDPIYADVAIRRWQSFTKRDAVLESTGQSFDQLAKVGRQSSDPRKARRRG